MNMNYVKEFYPTPESLIKKIVAGVDFKGIKRILEPSAGKGNICDYLMARKESYYSNYEIDCIEIDKELQAILKSKGYRVIHDDFLTFSTFAKYDLIIMNPPFSCGAAHLSKALDLIKNGGNIICILNAETIRNACTNQRIVLRQKLEQLNASIEFLKEEFVSAERETDVEIAVIKVSVPDAEFDSQFIKEMQERYYREEETPESTDLAENDFIKAAVKVYEIEVSAGIKLIREFSGMRKYMMNNESVLKLSLSADRSSEKLSINKYVQEVRRKYWNALFQNPKFTGKMTQKQLELYRSKTDELVNYEFSYHNIKEMQIEMSKNLVKGIEDCIMNLFEELSSVHSWYPECGNNIHFYNGWATNKAWYVNKKVVIPFMRAWDSIFDRYDPTNWELSRKIADIEKVFCYLDGGITDGQSLEEALKEAKETGESKNIDTKYFKITFYKKGTAHLLFKSDELLKRFNIFGSRNKKWLPPAYGKKAYAEMSDEERAVVDAFEGEKEYGKTLANASYYIYDPQMSLKAIEMTA